MTRTAIERRLCSRITIFIYAYDRLDRMNGIAENGTSPATSFTRTYDLAWWNIKRCSHKLCLSGEVVTVYLSITI